MVGFCILLPLLLYQYLTGAYLLSLSFSFFFLFHLQYSSLHSNFYVLLLNKFCTRSYPTPQLRYLELFCLILTWVQLREVELVASFWSCRSSLNKIYCNFEFKLIQFYIVVKLMSYEMTFQKLRVIAKRL